MDEAFVPFPALAEQLLAAVLPATLLDDVLGDLTEGYAKAVAQRGHFRAGIWLWAQTLIALPAFVQLSQTQMWRQPVNGPAVFREGKWSAALSAVFLVPVILIVIPGLLFSFFGKPVEATLNAVPGFARAAAWVDQPVVVLGGLALALLVNIVAVARVKFDATNEKILAVVSLKKSIWNLGLLFLTVLLGIALFAYLIAENILPLL